jgi:hypothetical protein
MWDSGYEDVIMDKENEGPWYENESNFEPMFGNNELPQKLNENYIDLQQSNENAFLSTGDGYTSTHDNINNRTEDHKTDYQETEAIMEHSDENNCYKQPQSPGLKEDESIDEDFSKDENASISNCDKNSSVLNLSVDQNNILTKKEGFYKKICTHRMEYLIKEVNKSLKTLIKNVGIKDLDFKKKLKFTKLPNLQFTSKIVTDFQKTTLKMTLFQIYSYEWVTNYEHVEKMDQLKNIKVQKLYPIKFTENDKENYDHHYEVMGILDKYKNEPTMSFMNKTLEEFTREYFHSKQFKKDKQKIVEDMCSDKCGNLIIECTGFCKLYEKKFMEHVFGGGHEVGFINDFLYSKGNNRKNEKKSKPNKKVKIEAFKVVKKSDDGGLTTRYEESESYCIDLSDLQI